MATTTIAILVSDQSIDHDLWMGLQEKHHYHLALFQELKPFVQFCCEDQPDLMAVSLHHPYEKINSLPQSLRKILQIPVICFAEKEDTEIQDEFCKHPQDQIVDVTMDDLSFYQVFTYFLNDKGHQVIETDKDDPCVLEERLYDSLGEGKSFGKIKIADQNEIIKEHRSRKIALIRADQKKKEGMLIEACDLIFKKVLKGQPVQKSSDFKTMNSFVLKLSMENYNGMLNFSCSRESYLHEEIILDLSVYLQNLFEEWGLDVDLSDPLLINSQTSSFIKSYSNFSEFLVHHICPDNIEWAVSFIKRESIEPNYSLTEDKKMMRMDIKSIPPQTELPFDGYIYLPKNGKYIKYLKQGTSISLEQVKRHSRDLEKSHIFIPIKSKNEVIKFFIQSTINWELALESETKVS